MQKPEGETGELFSTTEGWTVWYRAPDWSKADRFALYTPTGVFVGTYRYCTDAEREAVFRMMSE